MGQAVVPDFNQARKAAEQVSLRRVVKKRKNRLGTNPKGLGQTFIHVDDLGLGHVKITRCINTHWLRLLLVTQCFKSQSY
jgi:hypothetical protein